jgi:hypothetical protein
MTPDKIIEIIGRYEKELAGAKIPKKRMDPALYFRDLSSDELLAHAHYLCEGIKKYAKNSHQQRKAGSHLTAVQMCLSFAGWYTLEELMDHNRSDVSNGSGKQQPFIPGVTNFREPPGMT